MDEKRIRRVREMETALNEWADLGNQGEALLEAMTAKLPSLERLVAYYSSPDWMRDSEDSNEGRFPEDLSQGVLSEDAVFDLLTQLYGLAGMVKDMERRLGRIP